MGSLTEVCRGRWQGLLPAIGLDSRYLTGKHGPCPMCGGKDRWRFDDKQGKGTWFCTHCGAGDGVALVMRVKGCDWQAACALVKPLIGSTQVVVSRQERGARSLLDAQDRVWRGAETLAEGCLVNHYLERRGIVPDPIPIDLRYAEKCQYQASPRSEWYPAMLARVRGEDGEPCQLHRTFLDSVGNKAKVKEPRKLMPGPLPKGAAVRLAEPDTVLGIAEGIETALAASQLFSVPVWAALNAGQLLAWEPPAGVKEVMVFGDNDATFTGQSVAYTLARRLSNKQGLRVLVRIPEKIGCDFNDELVEVD